MDLALEAGEALAVTGANGAGKSTLLRILAGVLQPTEGEVALYVDGTVVSGEERPLRVGLVAPYLNVYDGFTTRENLTFVARARRLAHAASRIDELLDLVDLTGRADELVRTYSSGMKQRLRFAVALLADPPLLLLDEPTSNLDPDGVAMVDDVVARQRDAGGLLVMATNVAQEASRCDRVIRVEDYR